MGYYRAGFTEIVGIDIDPQPNYPFDFVRMDFMDLFTYPYPQYWQDADLIHASPPCQAYSDLAKRNGNEHTHPKYIEALREMLDSTNRDWVIENVEGAPLFEPLILCGTMFESLRVLRHRLFEFSYSIIQRSKLAAPFHPKHPLVYTRDKRKAHYGKLNEWDSPVSVNGGGNCSVEAARDAMGIDWMTKAELNEAIPPAYTEWIGRQLLESGLIQAKVAWTKWDGSIQRTEGA
jgi:DNA (cytosine-5)-methyltransferase 1